MTTQANKGDMKVKKTIKEELLEISVPKSEYKDGGQLIASFFIDDLINYINHRHARELRKITKRFDNKYFKGLI